MTDVHDIDLVYFDDKIPYGKSGSAATATCRFSDLASIDIRDAVEDDRMLEEELSAQFGLKFDVHNEAYMHLWHGRDITPYSSCENAMTRWLATVHAVGITGISQNLRLYAPFGLDDIFTRTIRPIVHKDNNRTLYEAKVAKWTARFDGLNVIPWPDDLE